MNRSWGYSLKPHRSKQLKWDSMSLPLLPSSCFTHSSMMSTSSAAPSNTSCKAMIFSCCRACRISTSSSTLLLSSPGPLSMAFFTFRNFPAQWVPEDRSRTSRTCPKCPLSQKQSAIKGWSIKRWLNSNNEKLQWMLWSFAYLPITLPIS